MSEGKKPCVVVVTGGAGFLGQHVVGLLQAHADHVTEIRVIDVKPYVNNLDYPATKPVRQFTGNITNPDLVQSACEGATSVMHVASIVDISLIPDKDLSYNINVVGTRNVIDACQKAGVRRLLYCSTCEVVCGHGNIYHGNEENTRAQRDGHIYQVYGSTKMMAEEMVLLENCDSLRTLSLRPVIMYGEEEWRTMARTLSHPFVKKTNRWLTFNCHKGSAEHAYVGNVAWSFICAENVMRRDDSAAENVCGQSFFVSDETPNTNVVDFMQPFLKEVGVEAFSWKVPIWMIIWPLYVLLAILMFVSLFRKVNLAIGLAPFVMGPKVFRFEYNKATRLLGYQPLYSVEESKERTVRFLKKLRAK
ncbi:3 beta-hydroxysteroid dehydrogenase/Delta 5--_4-isomerase type 4-like isoform X1 [Dreissena polymorpha]|uniref:3-beta hydroxysteroid dehydrogenase/isomerase domain-containing protein n=1 Tax=Dreissena polymorpha TaxID=45954 RepID=A0A9D4S627_DREPO|nr:3 beta-hydroxysteroid dehydrogenase/Delta 5-->4-isomerase type 4-like isoform X1 [Dreissena polymorpha]KAH3891853.1 hypothetical protein DPMN_015962 [Dreissena polymorpha]